MEKNKNVTVIQAAQTFLNDNKMGTFDENVKFTNAQYKTGVIKIAVAAMTARPVLKLCGKETADIPTLKKTIGLRQLFFGGRIYEKISKGGKGLKLQTFTGNIFSQCCCPGCIKR